MYWVWWIGGTWIVVGIALALVIGRSIHLAGHEAGITGCEGVPLSPVVPPPAEAPTVERRTPRIRQ